MPVKAESKSGEACLLTIYLALSDPFCLWLYVLYEMSISHVSHTVEQVLPHKGKEDILQRNDYDAGPKIFNCTICT